MIAKVTKNVIRANPKATPTTIPATAPFESRWLGRAGPPGCEVEVGVVRVDEAEPRELLVDVESCIC